MTRPKISLYAQPLDRVGTMNRPQLPRVLERSFSGCNSLKIGRTLLTALILSVLPISYSYAANPSQSDALRLYAHMKIYSYTQFKCYDLLIDRESMWSPIANNGNHYGLAQGTSRALLTMDGYAQVDWSIKYITNRYKTMCNALSHSYKYGWY
jgi:hypothetical protein